ncbi:MAG: GNAT family N-acetyltransferase [Streptosporangiales bacterium]|nr:GNAT family N-acetyltransferase [Streptosporangiales bacterium]
MQSYPDSWEADVVLTDGGTAHLRPIITGDADRLRRFHARLSPETIYYRFFAPYPRLSDRDVARFTTVDHDDRVALVATIGDELVAVVRYDRLRRAAAPGDDVGADAPSAEEDEAPPGDEAEVAFVVEDSHQGRGLASILLEHIAQAARERGLKRFVADVLPENRRMINVFREAGYTAQQKFDDGVIRLTLDLSPTETSEEVMRAREHRAESRSIGRLLHPRSVAVIGASRVAHSIGQTVLRDLLAADFQGPVYPVHPEAKAVAGVRAYPTVEDIDDDVDLAVVAVRAGSVPEVVDQCARKGVHGLVVVASGFGEAGAEGRARQEELVRAAHAGGMRVIGPNALGIANTDPAVRLNASLATTLPPRGTIGFFAQSGALGRAILQRVAQRGLGLSTFVSAGNRADVSGNDLLQYWEEDPDTHVVLQYLESLGNPRKFTRLARRLSRRKPIVAVKSGGSTQGVPIGHAAQALSLPDHAVSSLFEQAGVIRVDDITQLFDVAQLLAYQPLPEGNRVAILGNSGSLGLLAQDACLRAGLDPADPVDLGPDASGEEFAAALESAMADDAVHAVVAVFIPALSPRTPDVADAVRRVAASAGKPIAATYLGYQGLPEDLRQAGPEGAAAQGSVPSYPAPEDAVRALAHVTRYAAWRRRPHGEIPPLPDVASRAARRLVEELLADDERAEPSAADTERLLACYGIELWPAVPVGSAEEAIAAAERLGYPVVLRALAPGLRRRLDGSGIRRDLRGPETMRMAYATLAERPGAEAGLVVQRMAGPGVPTTVRAGEDPSFGAIVSFGLSDVAAELLDDRAYRLAPLTEVDAAGLVRAVRAAPLLFGHRGTDPVDVPALEDLLLRVSRLADDLPEVASLELEPVTVAAKGTAVLGGALRLSRPAGLRPDHGPRRLRSS